jgi:hypothetical protein
VCRYLGISEGYAHNEGDPGETPDNRALSDQDLRKLIKSALVRYKTATAFRRGLEKRLHQQNLEGRHFRQSSRPKFFVLSGRGNSQEDQKGAIQPNHILISETANVRPDFCLRNGCNLIYHQATVSSQSVRLTRFDEKPKKGSIGWIGREGTHRNRIRHVETVVLEDHHWSGLSCVVLATSYGPNLSPLHVPPWSEMASIKS